MRAREHGVGVGSTCRHSKVAPTGVLRSIRNDNLSGRSLGLHSDRSERCFRHGFCPAARKRTPYRFQRPPEGASRAKRNRRELLPRQSSRMRRFFRPSPSQQFLLPPQWERPDPVGIRIGIPPVERARIASPARPGPTTSGLRAISIQWQAVCQWHDVLLTRRRRRVLGCAAHGGAIIAWPREGSRGNVRTTTLHKNQRDERRDPPATAVAMVMANGNNGNRG